MPALQTVLSFELPPSNWAPPARLPDLSNETLISIDTETKDPRLTDLGPGWHRNDGYICGISVGWGGGVCYVPLSHFGDATDGSFASSGLDAGLVGDWMGTILGSSKIEIVMANAQYDLGWLKYHGIDLTGHKIRDIQIAESLLDEEPENGFGLDALAKKYLGESKDQNTLEAAARAYGLHPKKDLWQLPARYVGPYAEADARQTREIYLKQKPLLKAEGLWDVFEMECELIPILHKMNQQGIRVDVEKAIRVNEQWQRHENQCLKYFEAKSVDPWSGQSIARYCDRLQLDYPRTAPTTNHPHGQGSFTKEFLENSDHEFFRKIRHVREINRIRTAYVERDIIRNSVGGRVYPSFVQLACEEGGTRSGRFACKQPNVQQIPKRSGIKCNLQDFAIDEHGDGKIGAVVRSLYVPEPGQRWCKLDYSSQEPRMVVHYALQLGLNGSRRASEYFIQGKKLYDFLADALPNVEYATIKNLYLGRCYGMGVNKMAHTIGVDPDRCKEILEDLDSKAPFIQQLDDRVKRVVSRRGFLRTLSGRKRRFNWWTVKEHNEGEKYNQSKNFITRKKFPGAKRAFMNKCLNALIQGSAADQAKWGVIETFKAGYLPLLTLHDEGDWSVGSDNEVKELQEIMENVVKLELPTVCDPEVGPHWTA